MRNTRITGVFSALAALVGGALAFASHSAEAARAPRPPVIDVHPALFRIASGAHHLDIFGSYHILRRDVQWVTPSLLAAMKEADAFVFEVPVGEERMAEAQEFIDSRGYLPEGQTLRGLLSPPALTSYQTVLKDLPLNLREMDKLRPWLAQLTLTSAFYQGRKFSVINGADVRILSFAMNQKKPVHYLETPRQQLEFFFQSIGSFEVANFEALVTNFDNRPASIETGIAAWREGDVHELSMRLHRGLQAYPEARKILLDDRNVAWAGEIERLLKAADKSYFVTVGVGHLGGPLSVIEILCSRGWKVERIQTAGEPVDPACTPKIPS